MRQHLLNLITRHSTFCLLITLFTIALVTRLWHIEVPINFDEGYWVRRGVHFYVALLGGKLENTFLRHHPGVTNMWLIGAAFSLRYLLHNMIPLSQPFAGFAQQSDSLLAYLRAIEYIEQMPLEAYTSARFLSAFVTASSMVAFYWLSRCLLGHRIAFLATLILLFEPFFLAYQRSLTTDAYQTNFTWLALLAFLLYIEHKKDGSPAWRWLFLSAICYALALLSKIPALLSLPAIAFWLLWNVMKGYFGDKRALMRLLGELLCWGLIVGGVIFLLWPALWVALPQTLQLLNQQLSEEVEGHEQFFMGQMTTSPGAAFYPVVLLYRLSPVLLIGVAAWLLALLFQRRHRYIKPTTAFAIPINLLIVLFLLSSRASKIDRYIIPLIPGMALLAASAYSIIFAWWLERSGRGAEEARKGPRGMIRGESLIILIQLLTLSSYFPYNLSYFNPLLAGFGAEQVLMIGNGELLDQAAEWLNQEPNAESRLVASWYDASFAPYYHGRTVSLSADEAGKWPWVQAERVVLYVNQFQRQGIYYTAHTDYFSLQEPLHTINAHGIEYAQIYKGVLVSQTELAEINPTNFDFDTYATLLGYELKELPKDKPAHLPSGEEHVVTLYWQAHDPFPSPDYYVSLSLRHPNGMILSKEDQLPVHGFFPVTDWKSGQIIRDVHAIHLKAGTPPIEYTLEVGLYSPQQGQGLEIRDEKGAFGQQVPLTTLQVSRTPSALLSNSSLEIAHPIAAEQVPSLSGTRLLGYEWSETKPLRAGEGIPMTLLWQAGQEKNNNKATKEQKYWLYLRLDGNGQQWQRAIGHPLGGSYPPNEWTTGELVRDIWLGLLPPDAPTGNYQLELVAERAEQSILLLNLGQISIEKRPHQSLEVKPSIKQEAELGGKVRLLGYDLPTNAQSGQLLTLSLYWQALSEMEDNYTRFVHLLNEKGELVAQRDSVPGEGEYPTTTWVKDEILKDTLQINLPGELIAGKYHLMVGLYDPATWERLPQAQGKDHILLRQRLEVR